MATTFRELLDDFYPYAKKKLGFDKDAKIHFASDPSNGGKMLGKTAHYDPSDYTVTIYTDNRHPKDIMRSISHELVHHAQNCRGDLSNMSEHAGQPGYAQKDEHMREMEREAYEKGNMCFRDWEDGLKAKLEPGTIYESKSHLKKEHKETIMSHKDLRNHRLNNRLMESWGYKRPVKESADVAAGQMVVDLVDAGEMEWYEVARGDYMEQLMQHVESGAIADFDATQLAEFDIDAEEIELMWNKIQRRAMYDDEHLSDYDDIYQEGNNEWYSDEHETLADKKYADAQAAKSSLQGDDREFNVGDEVIANGYPGYITDLSIPGMATVKLGRGETTVSTKYVHKKDDKGIQGGEDSNNPEDDYNWVGHRAHYEENKTQTTTLREGYADVPDWVHQLVQMAADDNPDAYATQEVGKEFDNYVVALEAALEAAVGEEMAAKMMEEEADYAVLMGLMGHGVGIWDGRWDHFEEQGVNIKELEAKLANALGSFADDTGGGSLNDAIQNAAYESAGGDLEELKRRVEEALKEYGDHDTQAQGGLVSSRYSSDPEMDQVEDIALDVIEKGGQLMQVANALKGEGFDAFVMAGALVVGSKYILAKPDAIETGPDEEVREVGPYILGYQEKETRGEKAAQPSGEDQGIYDLHYTEAVKTDGRSPSDIELVDKIAELMTSDPEFRILQPFVDKFVRYSQSGGAVESSLEAALPDWVAGRHVSAIMKKAQGGQVEEGFRGSDEEKEMTSKMSNKEFSDYHTRDKHTVPNLKGDMGEIPGMEGPFQFRSGAVLYYDPKAGKYYDRGKDMYIDDEEASQLTMERKQMALREKVEKIVRKKLAEYGGYDDDPYADEDPYMSGLEAEFPWLADKKKKKGRKAMSDEDAAMAAAMADAEASGEFDAPPEEEEEEVYQESGAGSYKAGDKVKDLRNDNVGTVVEPMAGGAVIELEDGTIVKTRDKFLEVVGGDDPTMMKEEGGFDISQIQSRKDEEYDGMIHTIPGVRFTGNIDADVMTMYGMGEELENWLYGDLEISDSIEDAEGNQYAGSDVQDALAEVDAKLKAQEDGMYEHRNLLRRVVERVLAEADKLSDEQEELDLDDDGKIEPEDLAGLRSGKKDDDVGEEKEEEEEKNESIARTSGEFFDKLRNEKRTLSEAWNKDVKSDRASMLNDRLMKAWFNKK